MQDFSMTTQILYCLHNKAGKHRNLNPEYVIGEMRKEEEEEEEEVEVFSEN